MVPVKPSSSRHRQFSILALRRSFASVLPLATSEGGRGKEGSRAPSNNATDFNAKVCFITILGNLKPRSNYTNGKLTSPEIKIDINVTFCKHVCLQNWGGY